MRRPRFTFAILALIHVPAHAATFHAAPGPANSAIHLRQAINDTNANPGPDTVVVAAGTYEIESPDSDDTGIAGDLDISDDLVIQGAGAGSTFLDGAGISRLLDIHGPSAVTMSGLTLRNGDDNHADGGFLAIHDCAFLENTAVNGGATDNDGIATLVNTTITGNTATGTDEQGRGSGGIRVSEDSKSGTSLTLTHCTLYRNLAHSGGAFHEAGDIGNVSTKGARIDIQNSIFGSGYTDITLSSGTPGSMRSWGSNLFENDSGFNPTLVDGAPVDLVADPALDLLCDDGRPGHAHLSPLARSPAIDGGNGGNGSSGTTPDQLGQPRIDGDNNGSVLPDIGALESPGVMFETWRALRFDPAQRADCGISGPRRRRPGKPRRVPGRHRSAERLVVSPGDRGNRQRHDSRFLDGAELHAAPLSRPRRNLDAGAGTRPGKWRGLDPGRSGTGGDPMLLSGGRGTAVDGGHFTSRSANSHFSW